MTYSISFKFYNFNVNFNARINILKILYNIILAKKSFNYSFLNILNTIIYKKFININNQI